MSLVPIQVNLVGTLAKDGAVGSEVYSVRGSIFTAGPAGASKTVVIWLSPAQKTEADALVGKPVTVTGTVSMPGTPVSVHSIGAGPTICPRPFFGPTP